MKVVREESTADKIPLHAISGSRAEVSRPKGRLGFAPSYIASVEAEQEGHPLCGIGGTGTVALRDACKEAIKPHPEPQHPLCGIGRYRHGVERLRLL